jgi:hypothetical protein
MTSRHPSEENWTFVRLVRQAEAPKDRPFGMTTNARRLTELVGPTEAPEMVETPY